MKTINTHINAKPNSNGDTAETFRREGRSIAMIASEAQSKIMEMNIESLHGRNYQHRSDPIEDRAKDFQRLQNAISALGDLERLGIDIYLAGGNK